MKKEYTTPTVEVVEIAYPQLMSAISGEQSDVGLGDGTTDDNDPDLVGRRRGVWGNFWM